MKNPNRFREFVLSGREHSFEHEMERSARYKRGSRKSKGKIVKRPDAAVLRGESNALGK